MSLIKISTANTDLTIDQTNTFLTNDSPAGSSTLTVKNITNFATNQILLVGYFGNQGSEIIKTSASVAPTGSTVTLATNTVFPHSASTFITVLLYDQVEISTSLTKTGMKTVLTTTPLVANEPSTNYDDTTTITGFYFARFKNSISSAFSTYSDPIPVSGYGLFTARAIIDNALGEINKTISATLSNSFAFQQIDNCQTECLRELKRWSFMQKFDTIIGQALTGTWKLPVPEDLDDQNTNGSIYFLKLGANPRLIWVDKEKFDDFTNDMVYTTLADDLEIGDLVMTLTDSSDFNTTNGSSGTVQIGANTYSYSANDTSTGILTLSEAITADNTADSGADVFGSIQTGQPQYWTIYGGYIYWFPVTAPSYNQKNMRLNYYIKQTRITTDTDTIILPDQMVVTYYLAWKFLKKLNNGEETTASQAYQQAYLLRREKMKQKETLNRTFVWKPYFQNFAIRSELNENDSRIIRDGNFPNTGF